MLETSLGPLCPRVAVESYAHPEAAISCAAVRTRSWLAPETVARTHASNVTSLETKSIPTVAW